MRLELPRCKLAPVAVKVLTGAPIAISIADGTLDELEEARALYLAEARRRGVYGYCTGLGDLASKRHETCPPDWEERVVEEHSIQVGPEASPGLTRLFLLVRLNQLLRLPAPVRPEIAARLAESLTRGITPIIRVRGSVGASGDLSPSAQAVRCLYYGRGRAAYRGRIIGCREALRAEGMDPLPLEAGEALFLINNTAWSTATCMAGAIALGNTVRMLVDLASKAARILGASREHYEPELLEAKNCRVGAEVARSILQQAAREPRRLQAPYSVRCSPQILGASLRMVETAIGLLEEEACASTENPSIVSGRVLHGCNFHAVKVSYACSILQSVAGYLAAWGERLAAQLLRGDLTGLPDYLAGPGSSVGAMIVHYTLASLSARIRGRAGLEHLYNTPTSGLQEDVVSMAPAMAESVLDQARDLAGMAGLIGLIVRKASRGEAGPYTGLQEEAEKAYVEAVRRAAPWLA